MDYAFPRYLAAKKTVDDRALNRSVWQTLAAALPARPLEVLEVGAGIGTMVERMIEWGLLSDATYTAVDAQPENIAEARRRLPRWAEERGYGHRADAGGALGIHHAAGSLEVWLEAADLSDFLARAEGRTWDLLVAHAFLDLIDVAAALPALSACLRPGGQFYFTLNFDGATILQPAIDPDFDDRIETLYHRTMNRPPQAAHSSGSRAGRNLFGQLRRAGLEVLDAGSSDWVVFAREPRAGGYAADEAYFLHFIIHTIDGALRGHPDLDPDRFAAWIDERHAQIERGELVYIAHQLDFVGRAMGREGRPGS